MKLSDFRPPVINLTTGELTSISLDDVEQITKYVDDVTIYHINGVEYKLITDLADYKNYMFDLGMRKLDRSVVVNAYHVKEYNDARSVVFFDEERKRFAQVASVYRKYAKALAEGMRDRKRLHQIDREYIENEKTTNKNSKKFLEFFTSKLRKT